MLSDKILKRAHKLSYALFMVAEHIPNSPIKEKIKERVAEFMDAAGGGDTDLIDKDLGVLKNLVIFSNGVGQISYDNNLVLIEEIDRLLRDVKEEINSFPQVNVKKIFEESGSEEEIKDVKGGNVVSRNIISDSTNRDGFASVFSDSGYIRQDNSAIRQDVKFGNSAIDLKVGGVVDNRRKNVLGKIKENNICFLRDLLVNFPDYSERTIRYDLEELLRDGKIEKVGNSGPGTFYRVLEQ